MISVRVLFNCCVIYTQTKDPWANKNGWEFLDSTDQKRVLPAINNFNDRSFKSGNGFPVETYSNYEKENDMSLIEIPYLIDKIQSLEDAPTQEYL